MRYVATVPPIPFDPFPFQLRLVQASWIDKYPFYATHAEGAFILDYQHISNTVQQSFLSFDKYIEIAYKIRPQFLVIPDCFQDSAATVRQAKSFFSTFTLPPDCDPLIVPQGRTIEEVISCAYELVALSPGSPLIGLPKVIDTYSALSKFPRLYVAERLSRFGPPHLLGIWNGLSSLIELVLEIVRTDANIFSIDTTLPFAMAQSKEFTLDKVQLNENAPFVHNPANFVELVNAICSMTTPLLVS